MILYVVWGQQAQKRPGEPPSGLRDKWKDTVFSPYLARSTQSLQRMVKTTSLIWILVPVDNDRTLSGNTERACLQLVTVQL